MCLFLVQFDLLADELTGERTGKLKVRRRGNVLEIEQPILPKPKIQWVRAMAMFASGGEHHLQALTVRDNRLLIAQGPRGARAGSPTSEKRGRARHGAHPRRHVVPHRGRRRCRLDSTSCRWSCASPNKWDESTTDQLKLMFAAVPGLAALHAPLVMVVRSGRGDRGGSRGG